MSLLQCQLRQLRTEALIDQKLHSAFRIGFWNNTNGSCCFRYSLDGIIANVGDPFDRLREPSAPIPAPITALTGISDAMVAGQRIDPDEVTQFALSAAVVIAHNAAFDRKFLQRFCSSFSFKPWACSMAEIDWAAEGFEGTKLEYFAVGCGFFCDQHRTANDCLAAVEVLSRSPPKSGVNALGHLLARARLPTWRIWAEGSPKDHLKSRGVSLER